MRTPTNDAAIDDGAIDNRRKSVGDRRLSPRTKKLKGARIVWPGSVVRCIIRNLSETGAKMEAHGPIPANFELVFDLDQSRRSCRVMWRKEAMIGVKFI